MNKSAILFLSFVALCAGEVSAVDPLCVGKPEQQHFAVEGSCSQVNLCYYGTLYLQSCPDNLLWNEVKGFCTYPSLSGCIETEPIVTTVSPTTEPVDITDPNETCLTSGSEISFHPYPGSCENYIVCSGIENAPIEMKCADGYGYSAKASQCVPKKLSDCQDEAVKCPTDLLPNEILYLAEPSSCKTYHICVNQMQHEMECSENYLWNETVNSCDIPENVACAPKFVK